MVIIAAVKRMVPAVKRKVPAVKRMVSTATACVVLCVPAIGQSSNIETACNFRETI